MGPTTNQLEEVVLYGSIQYSSDVPTFYTRFGDWFAYLAMLAGLIALVVPGGRMAERTAAEPRP